jgi:hypothetical protein
MSQSIATSLSDVPATTARTLPRAAALRAEPLASAETALRLHGLLARLRGLLRADMAALTPNLTHEIQIGLSRGA